MSDKSGCNGEGGASSAIGHETMHEGWSVLEGQITHLSRKVEIHVIWHAGSNLVERHKITNWLPWS